jgi:hypothetical protein
MLSAVASLHSRWHLLGQMLWDYCSEKNVLAKFFIFPLFFFDGTKHEIDKCQRQEHSS